MCPLNKWFTCFSRQDVINCNFRASEGSMENIHSPFCCLFLSEFFIQDSFFFTFSSYFTDSSLLTFSLSSLFLRLHRLFVMLIFIIVFCFSPSCNHFFIFPYYFFLHCFESCAMLCRER